MNQVEHIVEVSVLKEKLQEHLKAHPLEVSADEVAMIVDRLQVRIGRGRSPLPWIAGLITLAAVALFVARGVVLEGASTPETDQMRSLVEEAPTEQILAPSPVRHPHRVVAGADARWLESASPHIVVLVQRGEVHIDDHAVQAGEWGVAQVGSDEVVVFVDGTAPPFDTGRIQAQLVDLRWRSLPARTLENLERQLETR